jgi:hypothetical protein
MASAVELAVYETFEDIFGRKSSLDELVSEVASFTQQSVLWVCSEIAVGLQLWTRFDLQSPDTYAGLISRHFGKDLQLRFMRDYWSSNPRRLLFHRRQVLFIAKLAILHCSAGTLDARAAPRRFGSVLLKANDHFHHGLVGGDAGVGPTATSREDFAKLIAEMIAVSEEAGPDIAPLITRSHLMLTRFTNELEGDPDFVDAAKEYERSTGLSLHELEALVFATHARFGEGLAKRVFSEPGVLPLKDENFSTVAVSDEKVTSFIDSLAALPCKMAGELQKRDFGANDFTIFRRFPLIQQFYNMHLKSAWCGFLMMDNNFFLEKVLAAPFWNSNLQHGQKLRKFWGAVFERYVNELMRKACAGTRAEFFPDPRPTDNPSVQLCDGIVVADDTAVLMEYKSSMFRADTKYSGDHSALGAEIESKLVYDRESNSKKGVRQLASAVESLFGEATKVKITGLDVTKIKRVYLYLVTLDAIGDTICLSPFLNTFLDEILDRSTIPVEIRPLFCTSVEALERATSFFGSSTLAEILEWWVSVNPPLAMPLAAVDLAKFKWQENSWLRTEWNGIFVSMVKILFPNVDPDTALAEGLKMGQRRKP